MEFKQLLLIGDDGVGDSLTACETKSELGSKDTIRVIECALIGCFQEFVPMKNGLSSCHHASNPVSCLGEKQYLHTFFILFC